MASPEREPIGVIGTGYVGLVTAAGFAELGSEVFCVDIDAEKIARLKEGIIPIYEPGLAELVAKHAGRLHFSTDIADALDAARLLFVAVGTPPTYSGDADLSAVHAVVNAMPASDRHALVMKSTVPVGTGASIKRTFAQQGKQGFRYVSCPEFLKEGSAVKDFLNPDRVVVGDDGDWAGDAVVELYRPLDAPVVRTDIPSAEMVKLASNAFLATKISFINEIANVCEETGADVIEVAKGMGLDDRIGPKFLQAGIGFGGSCLTGDETVLVRHHGRTTLQRLDELWRRLEADNDLYAEGVIEPYGLQVLAWSPDSGEPLFLDVLAATRRDYDGDVIEVRTKTGRRVKVTPDHPMVVGDGRGGEPGVRAAGDLTRDDWLPLAAERTRELDTSHVACVLSAVEAADLSAEQLVVRPPRAEIDALVGRPMDERRMIFNRSASAAARTGEVKRTGTMRYDEVGWAGVSTTHATLGTASNGAFVTSSISLDRHFWRVAGLYLAEGHASFEETGTARLQWSFHPEREQHLVDDVVAFWLRHNVKARVAQRPTSRTVTVQSRLVTAWWTKVLGMGRGSYTQRLPDLVWERSAEDKWALLGALFEGDGSWSLVNGGPSVIIEMGTVSDELADGVMRLLLDVGIVASKRVARVAKSTKDTTWIRISGADQVERSLALVPERDREGVRASLDRQRKRIAPMGYRRFEDGPWVRVTSLERRRVSEPVYSLDVPYAHTFVTSDGLAVHNCFPKDVSALKQLAGNSGYHFQLLNAVIEVNELQKRRVIGKLQKHLGSLVGKKIALLGLAFKPNTDDMREASSLVLAARLQADGAQVSAFDPVAEEEARGLIPGVRFGTDALDTVRDADATVLVTEWDEFRSLDFAAVAGAMAGTLVIDGRNALDAGQVAAAGLTYEGVGRGGQAH
jgi:UDPglucose 6-dehydrogenase